MDNLIWVVLGFFYVLDLIFQILCLASCVTPLLLFLLTDDL